MSTTIAHNKIPMQMLAYREVVVIDGETAYLQNVNIMFGRKIIKKIRFQPGEKPYSKGMGKEIAVNYLRKLFDEKEQNRKQNPTAESEANHKAAKNLFNELGIQI